jgi:hypothetical protein
MKLLFKEKDKELRFTQPDATKPKADQAEARLKLGLLNQSELREDEQAMLEGEVVLHVRKLVKSKQNAKAFAFLKSVREFMSEGLRELLSEELKVSFTKS